MEMANEPHLSTRVFAYIGGDDGKISGDAEFKQIHIVKHDNLHGVLMANQRKV